MAVRPAPRAATHALAEHATFMAKVVLITGASAGIGRACADRLHEAGWTVVGASRRGTSSGPWQGVVMDVDSDDAVRAGIADVMARYGRIDAVVASAGWGVAGAVEHTTIAEAKAQVETNLWGATRVVQGVLPAMRSPGGRPDRPHQLDRRCRRHSVPGLLQRQQVRTRGVGRSTCLRGGAVRDRRDARRARQRPDRLHRQPEDGGCIGEMTRSTSVPSARRWV